MEASAQIDQIFRGIYMFDSPFVSKYFDEEDEYTFDNSSSLKSAYDNVRGWLKYAVILNRDYVFRFGQYIGIEILDVLENDAQYIEYCLREVDRFFLEPEFIKHIIGSGYRFSHKTIFAYRRKLADLEAAEYIANAWKNLDARLARQRKDSFDEQESDWLNYGQWRDL